MKEQIKKIPVFGPFAQRSSEWLRRRYRVAKSYHFERTEPDWSGAPREAQVAQVMNLLNYTKTSGTPYAAKSKPAGYQTIDLGDVELRGARNPRERLAVVPLDFDNKTVLDIGCNQGGMLFELADRISHGVGIDYDHRMVNVANRIRSYKRTDRLDFYVFDLAREELSLIGDLLPSGRVDVAFLLAVCMWIPNWRQVIDYVQSISDHLLFESNGTPRQQKEQVAYLRARYDRVDYLAHGSDDEHNKTRQLYLCSSR